MKEIDGSIFRLPCTPREVIFAHFGEELPIAGGWGYDAEAMVIIDKNDPIVPRGLSFDGIGIEYQFVEKRLYEELIFAYRPHGECYAGIRWNLESQSLRVINGRHCDVLDFVVTAFLDSDWEKLKADWESHDYKNDKPGLLRHRQWRDSLQVTFHEEFWFDIESFFGVAGEIQ